VRYKHSNGSFCLSGFLTSDSNRDHSSVLFELVITDLFFLLFVPDLVFVLALTLLLEDSLDLLDSLDVFQNLTDTQLDKMKISLERILENGFRAGKIKNK
jgi:hypothetical protein